MIFHPRRLSSRAQQLEGVALLEQMLVVCPAGSPARRARVDACGLAPGVTEHRRAPSRNLPDAPRDKRSPRNAGTDAASCECRHAARWLSMICTGERCLALAAALLRDEEMAIHVGAKARQDVTAIPSKAAGNLVRDLTDNVLLFGFCVPGGNVKEQLASRTIWFAEVAAASSSELRFCGRSGKASRISIAIATWASTNRTRPFSRSFATSPISCSGRK